MGQQAVMSVTSRRSWFSRHTWWLLRRTSQLTLLGLFLAGPLYGLWILKGNLASSTVFSVLPLTDPYIYLQSIAAGHKMGTLASMGALNVVIIYLLLGGRAYCSWVCPINIVTDLAYWLRTQLGISASLPLKKSSRNWLFIMVLIVSALTTTIAWEIVNPITLLQRGLVFGMGMAWVIMLAVFLLDVFVSRRAWCGHLCPVGVFYGVLGKVSLIRIKAADRQACTDCGDCFTHCPEPQVIAPALKPANEQASPLILSGDCTNCGRCIDVCDERVFTFATRWRYGKRP